MEEGVIKIINNWNPIGIYPLLKEEYDIEIEKIMEVLYENRSAQELAEKIFEIFAAFFGKEFDKTLEECERVANEIIGLRTSFIHIEARLHRESTQLFKRKERDY